MLEKGQPAPDFTLPCVTGETVTLSACAGRVLLWFSRGFGCPFCRRSMSQLAASLPHLNEQAVTLLQISPNLLSAARLYYRLAAPPFPLLCDPELVSYRRYGLQEAGNLEGGKQAARSAIEAVRHGEVGKTLQAHYYEGLEGNPVERIMLHLTNSYQQGLFLLDESKQLHHVWLLEPLQALPPLQEILTVLRSA